MLECRDVGGICVIKVENGETLHIMQLMSTV